MKDRKKLAIFSISIMTAFSCTEITDSFHYKNLAHKIIAFETECPPEKLEIQNLGMVSFDERIDSSLNEKVSFFGCGFKGVYHCQTGFGGNYTSCIKKYINVKQELSGDSDNLQKAIHTYFTSEPGKKSLIELMNGIQSLDAETKKIFPSYLDFISTNRFYYHDIDALYHFILLFPIHNFESKKSELKELLGILDKAKFESRSILEEYFKAEASNEHAEKLKKMLEIAETKKPSTSKL